MHLVSRGAFATAYDLPVPDSVRLNVQAWLASESGGASLVEFYLDGEKGLPRILYLERQRRRLYLIFEAAFLSQLLDVSPNIGTDDRIFLYNAHEQPFLSNTIEEEYRVPADWQAGIHKLFWENQINGVQDLTIRDTCGSSSRVTGCAICRCSSTSRARTRWRCSRSKRQRLNSR
jgi:hypothetical protein